jgi:VWFA-related protein
MPPEKTSLAILKRQSRAHRIRSFSLIALVYSALGFLVFSAAARPHPHLRQQRQLQQHPQKHPKPRQLDKGIQWRRDPATGELSIESSPNAAAAADETTTAVPAAPSILIGPTTRLVPITCSVFIDATPLRDLTAKDFRVFDDGVERPILIFDAASSEPARVALVIDASPSVLRDSLEMKKAAGALIEGLAPADEIAIVDFSAHTYVQSDFTSVRELLRRAVDRVDVRQLLGDTGGSNIYEAVYLAAHQLFVKPAGRKAIVLLTDGQDSGLGLTLDPESASPRPGAPENRLTFDDVSRELAAKDVQVFVVSTENRPKIMSLAWLAAHRDKTLLTLDVRKSRIPAYTLYLAEIVRRSGGELYFLHESGTLAATFQQVAERVGVEYTLGISPQPESGDAPHPGWHQLRVETVGLGNTSVVHRSAYYVPAAQ